LLELVVHLDLEQSDQPVRGGGDHIPLQFHRNSDTSLGIWKNHLWNGIHFVNAVPLEVIKV
jgi:hypothetical protein